mgnify:CR=1 FL=1
MTPQEQQLYFAHQAKRNQEEAEKVNAHKARLKAYKEILIKDILERRTDFTREQLTKKSIRTLERIY